jgi:hypothetical protein
MRPGLPSRAHMLIIVTLDVVLPCIAPAPRSVSFCIATSHIGHHESRSRAVRRLMTAIPIAGCQSVFMQTPSRQRAVDDGACIGSLARHYA